MAALRHLVRMEMRQRWRGLLVLALMAGLVAGVVLGAAAGARRTASALDRFRAATASMDVNVQAQSPEQRNALLNAARSLPQVQVAAPYAVVPIGAESEIDLAIALPVDGQYGTAVDRPRVLSGRLPAQNAAEEVIISEYVADVLGLRLGDQATFPTFVPKDLMDAISGGEFRGLHGPPITARVVGIGRLPQEFESGAEDGGPVLFGTEALYRRVVGKSGMFDDSFGARLRDPAHDEAAFATAMRDQAGSDEGLSVGTADENYASSGRDALRFSANAILIVALLTFAAGTVVVLQMANRERADAHARSEQLRALGSTRREQFGAVAIPQFISAVGAVVFGVIIAIAGSFVFPAGFAREAEPRTGLSIDALALGGGAALLIAIWILLIAAFASRRDDRTEARRRSPSIRLSIAPAPDLGVARALRSGGFGAGATTAVLLASTGIVAVALFVGSLGALVDAPERWGYGFSSRPDVIDPSQRDALIAKLVREPEIADAGTAHRAVVNVGGQQVDGYAIESRNRVLGLTILAGRVPAHHDEIVVGERTLRRIKAEIGDEVDIRGAAGGTARLRIVGLAAFPLIDSDHPGDGAWFGEKATLEASALSDGETGLMLRYRPDLDRSAVEQRLAEKYDGDIAFSFYSAPRKPGQLANLERASAVAPALALFFGLIGIAGLVHALVVSNRRRNSELAVVRALGFRPRDVRRAVRWQAYVPAVVGTVAGVALGLLLGRVVWQGVVGSLGVDDAPTMPVAFVAFAVPAAVVLAAVCAWWPARVASARSVSDGLRSE